MPADLLTEPIWNSMFGEFMAERARKIYALIEHYAITPLNEMAKTYGSDGEIDSEEQALSTPTSILNVLDSHWVHCVSSRMARGKGKGT
ncbi:hypothetical protein CJ255_20425 [Candidatus Viridilinea mediisalina]|uniref:Uncharacterized protein n=2 Tax=Candidatus Viridilinea mediisalina TaxID=2024553 RepID=A0A2A6RDN9_9CHLR|nr:hypothetical protein CJ255_20425 [Candidatus Viridilinea mediisalina]